MGNNNTYEALQGIKIEIKDNLNEYIAFCKYAFKPKNYEKVLQYNLNREELIKDFPFLKDNFDKNFLKKRPSKKSRYHKRLSFSFLKRKNIKK
jgi:hypothetical protein